MAKREVISVNNMQFKAMLADGTSLDNETPSIPTTELKEEQEIREMPDNDIPKETARSGRKKKEQVSYEELYLTPNPVNKLYRQQIYVDGQLYERFSHFLRVSSESKMSMTSFINNILLRHWEDNEGTIRELYEKSLKKPL